MTFALFKIKKIWHYRFQIGGARVQRSTRERNKARAEAVATRAYDEEVVRTNGGKPVPKLEALFREWLLVRGPVSSPAHVRSVDTCMRLHLYDLGDLPVSDITARHIELARNEHLATREPATANHWLRIMRLITNWAVEQGMLARRPWNVAMLSTQKRPRKILPLDVAMQWLGEIDRAGRRSPAVSTAIRFMFGLGLRESEAASARWEWIDWERRTYTPGITKGKEAEPVPMPTWLVDYLQARRQSEGLITARKDGSQQPPGFARRPIATANAHCKTKGITPHRLRGSFATLLSESGVPIQTIQKVLRHKSPLTTMAYLEKNLDTAVQAQGSIAKKMGFTPRRESGEDHPANPHET